MFMKDIIGRREEECYYKSRKLYQHMKNSYKRKQIVMRPYGAKYVQDIQQLTLE